MSHTRSQRAPFGAVRPAADSVPERLLAAAMELVEQEGLRGLSQARVAAAAGLRQSHLTYYFPTRKDLIKALVRNIHGEMMRAWDSLASETAGGASPETAREFFVRRLREPLMARLMLALMNSVDEAPSLRRWLAEFDADMVERLRDTCVRAGLRPTEDDMALLHASFVGAAILGAQTAADDGAGIERTDRLVRLAFDRMADGAPSESDGPCRHEDATGRLE
ncbi:MAG: TetR/AcrR family transcriptional regulator [Acidihalobacter sp.]